MRDGWDGQGVRGTLARGARNRWVAPVLAALAVWAITALLLAGTPAQSGAQAVVALVPREGRSLPTASMIQLLSTRYVASGSSAQTAQEVAQQLQLDPAEVTDAVRLSIPENTTNVSLAVVTDEADTALAIAEAYAAVLVEQSDTDPDLSGSIVVPAHATGVVRADQRRLLMIGLAAGLVLGALALGLVGLLSGRTRA